MFEIIPKQTHIQFVRHARACAIASTLFLVVSAVGLVYLLAAKPERKSTAPEGDAMEVAERLRSRAAALESTTGGNPA